MRSANRVSSSDHRKDSGKRGRPGFSGGVRSSLPVLPSGSGSVKRSSVCVSRRGIRAIPVAAGSNSTSLPCQPRHVVSDRVAVVREMLAYTGFAPETTELLVKDIRPSTSAVYNSQWKLFTVWCVAITWLRWR